MTVLKSFYLPADSTSEEIEQAMTEACAEYEEAYATCELTAQGYRIKITKEPQR